MDDRELRFTFRYVIDLSKRFEYAMRNNINLILFYSTITTSCRWTVDKTKFDDYDALTNTYVTRQQENS